VRIRAIPLSLVGPLTAVLLSGGALGAQSVERLRFVTTLGQDTTAVEQFDRTDTSVVGDIVFRAPRARIVHYDVVTTRAHRLVSAVITAGGPKSAGANAPLSTIRVVARGDSLVVERTQGDSVTRRTVAAPGPTIPWISAQSVGLWELVLRAATPKTGDSVEVAGLSLETGKTMRVYVSRFQRDSARVDYERFDIATHLGLDDNGHVTGLDGTPSTIKIRANLVASLDLPALADRFGSEDAAGRAPGALSPRDTARANVGGATISIDYGRPSRRGRDVWSVLLPKDEVWRLGANAATTLRTTHPLQFNGVPKVPAGSYTIWLIPGTETGTFIINSETGQWGTQYKVARDVTRFPVRFEAIGAGTPEQFTARIAPNAGNEGALLFEWDGRRYVIPFHVLPAV
jgi:Protein of unknown function (DUF2911)